jgi:hypothetical protein
MTPFDELVEREFGCPGHPDWCSRSACTVDYDSAEWVGHHLTEHAIVSLRKGEVGVHRSVRRRRRRPLAAHVVAGRET